MTATAPTEVVNAMTVDVEDYFQVSAFEPYVRRDEWDTKPCRVEANVDRILSMFAQTGVTATFFTLGWIAERYPGMTQKIVDEGHELASHGWEHVRVTQQDRFEFAEDVKRTKNFLEDLTGKKIKGYRAASYSINNSNLWAHDVLADTGYEYSSSIVPIKHDLYGIPDAPRFAHTRESSGLLEIPISTVSILGRNFSCGGGGWFRLYPYSVSRWAINRVNQQEKKSCIFYFHPWEVDPDQPVQKHLDIKTRFRHYLNLSKTENRLKNLLIDFRWGRIEDIYL